MQTAIVPRLKMQVFKVVPPFFSPPQPMPLQVLRPQFPFIQHLQGQTIREISEAVTAAFFVGTMDIMLVSLVILVILLVADVFTSQLEGPKMLPDI